MHDQDALQHVREAMRRHEPLLGEGDNQFLKRVFQGGLEPYRHRLRAYGFAGQERVLDAGCGFGQWSIALALLNDSVDSVDVSEGRILFLKEVAERIGLTRLAPRTASISRLPFPDHTFSAVFCYGVLFLTPWKATLAEVARVLRPSGRFYVNANGIGWFKHLWYNEPNKAADYRPREVAAHVLLNSLRYNQGHAPGSGAQLLIEPEDLQNELRGRGFKTLHHAAEGCALDPAYAGPPPAPFFQGTYLGDTGVYEILAIKSA